jgi:hypothetical protein
MVGLKERLRQAALEVGVDLFGVAPAERLEEAPEGYRPSDLLRGVKSLVCMGVGMGSGVREAVLTAYSGLRHTIYSYMMLNDLLNLAAFRVYRILEEEGYLTLPIPASPPYDHQQLKGAVSHRHAAVAAGLGELGWNSLLITPKYGPRVRLVTLLTKAELEADPQYFGKPLCNKKLCQLACVKACPVKAIHPEKHVSVRIGGKTYRYAVVDHWKCRLGLEGLIPGTVGRQPVKLEEEASPEAYLKALVRADPWQRMELYRGASICGLCIMHCPVGQL